MIDHDAIRERLERRLARLEHRVGRIQSDLRRPGDRDWTETATERENDEVLERLDEAELAELARIRTALSRLATGSYGRCAHCRREIQAERLEALPFADTCIDCAEAGEAPA